MTSAVIVESVLPKEVEQRGPSMLVRRADDVVRHPQCVGRAAPDSHRDLGMGERRDVVVTVSNSEHLGTVDARESAVGVDATPLGDSRRVHDEPIAAIAGLTSTAWSAMPGR